MSKSLELLVSCDPKDQRYATVLESLCSKSLNFATRRALEMASSEAETAQRPPDVMVVLLGSGCNSELPNMLESHYKKNGCVIIGVLLHDHPNFKKAMPNIDLLPTCVQTLVKAGKMPLYSWSNSSKDVQGWFSPLSFNRA